MWNKNKSIMLTHLIVRACYFFLAAAVVGLPILLKSGFYQFDILGKIADYVIWPFYAVVPAGYVALICLDKLLINVKKDIIFNEKNVKLLRIISWACFYAGFVGMLSFVIIVFTHFMFETLFILAIGEMFMGLVVRVVKNVFEAAIEIKEENELTI